MQSLSEQLLSKMNPRLDSVNEKVGRQVAGLFEDQMKDNTRQGKGFGADPYDAQYSESHRKARTKKGYQTDRVDLRMGRRRIDNTHVELTSGRRGGAKIQFVEGGDIFKLHHTGTAKGDYTRSIWPKSPESIPQGLIVRAKEFVTEVLRGQK